MKEFVAITKALSDENRVRALMALGKGELCVCQIIELLGLAPSTVSKHMAILRQAGLVETRKEGRWIYYRTTTEGESACAHSARAMVARCLVDDRLIREDTRRLRTIRKMKRGDLCVHYHK